MGIFSIIGTIIVGFIVGVLARWIFPGTVPLGFWLTVGLGIGGSTESFTRPAGSCPSRARYCFSGATPTTWPEMQAAPA